MMPPVRRYGALEMLADHLNQQRGYGIPQRGLSQEVDPAVRAFIEQWGSAPGTATPVPPGLPDAVQESIREAPSYSERAVLPSRRPAWNAYSDFAPEFAHQLRQDPMEREQLNYELGMASQFPSAGMPLAEGQIGAPADTVDRRYSRPYNLGLGNLGALY